MHVAENYWFNWLFGHWTFRHRFDVGTMLLRVFELNVKNPAFAKQKIAQMRRVFFEELQRSRVKIWCNYRFKDNVNGIVRICLSWFFCWHNTAEVMLCVIWFAWLACSDNCTVKYKLLWMEFDWFSWWKH